MASFIEDHTEPTLKLTSDDGCIDEYIIPMQRVCVQSGILKLLNTEGAYTKPLNLHIRAFSQITVQQMASFFARDRYEVGAEDLKLTDQSNLDALQQHIHVYAAATYYDIPRLSILALDGIKKELDSRWSAEAFIAALKEIQHLFPELQASYSKTLAQSASKHVKELIQYTEFNNHIHHNEFLTHLKQICQIQLETHWSVQEFISILRATDTLFSEPEPAQYEMLASIAYEHIEELLRCNGFTGFRLADSFLTSLRITWETKLQSNWSVQKFIHSLMAMEALFPEPESTKYETLAWIASEHIDEIQECATFSSYRLPDSFMNSLKIRCEIRLQSKWSASEFISVLELFITILPDLGTDYGVLAKIASDNIEELASTEFRNLILPEGLLILVIEKTKSKHKELFEAAERATTLNNMFWLLAGRHDIW